MKADKSQDTRAMDDQEVDNLLEEWSETPRDGIADIRRKASEIVSLCAEVSTLLTVREPGGTRAAPQPDGDAGESDDSVGTEGDMDDDEPYLVAIGAGFLTEMTGIDDMDELERRVAAACGEGAYPGQKTREALEELEQIWADSPNSWRRELGALCGAQGEPPRASDLVWAALSVLAGRVSPVSDDGTPPEDEDGRASPAGDAASQSTWLEEGPTASDDETDEEQADREELEGELETLRCMARDAIDSLEDDFAGVPWDADFVRDALARAKASVPENAWRFVVTDDPPPSSDIPEDEAREVIAAISEMLGPLDDAVEELEQERDRAHRKRDRLWATEDLIDWAAQPVAKKRRQAVVDAFDRLVRDSGAGDEDGEPAADEIDAATTAAEKLIAGYLSETLGEGPSTAALREHHQLCAIREEQSGTDLAIPPSAFARLCDELLQDYSWQDRGFHFDQGAYAALQTAAEDYLVRVLGRAGNLAIHAGRTLLGAQDLRKAAAAESV